MDLTVRGPTPHGFFSLLRDGFELILRRFEGLDFRRRLRCQCTPGCEHWFDYDKLLEWQERTPPITEVQCHETGKTLPLVDILFGIDSIVPEGPEGRVMERLGGVIHQLDGLEDHMMGRFEDQDEMIRSEIGSLSQLVHRGFLHQFRREQRFIESHCPRVFTLKPVDSSTWAGRLKELLHTKWELQLFCEAPSFWHPTSEENGGRYEIEQPKKWVEGLVPYLNGLVKVLKFAAPVAGPWLKISVSEYEILLKDRIALMKGLVSQLSELEVGHGFEDFGVKDRSRDTGGAELRGLRQLLIELDPKQQWGGLRKVLTPEGHYFWLCKDHADEFVPKPRGPVGKSR